MRTLLTQAAASFLYVVQHAISIPCAVSSGGIVLLGFSLQPFYTARVYILVWVVIALVAGGIYWCSVVLFLVGLYLLQKAFNLVVGLRPEWSLVHVLKGHQLKSCEMEIFFGMYTKAEFRFVQIYWHSVCNTSWVSIVTIRPLTADVGILCWRSQMFVLQFKDGCFCC